MINQIPIEKELVRRIELIRYINYQNRWFTVKELANYMQVADQTIRKDIELLEDEIPMSWKIIIQKGKGVYLEKPLNEPLDFVHSKILRNSLVLKICEELAFKKNTIPLLAQKFHFNTSSFYTMINQIHNKLKVFNLAVQKRPLEISGREQDVRTFMLNLYCNTISEYWPFPYINKLMILDIITKLENRFEIKLYQNAKYKLCVMFGITISRLLSGKTIQQTSDFISVDKNGECYKAFASIAEELRSIFGVILHENELSFLEVSFLLSIDHQAMLNHSRKSCSCKKTFMPLAKKIIREIELKLQLGIDYDEEFIMYVVSIIHRVSNKFIVQNYDHNVQFVKYIEKKHSDTFNIIRDYVNTLEYSVKSQFDAYDIALLTLHFETKRITHNVEAKKVYVYNSQSCIHRKYIAALLKKKYGNLIEIIEQDIVNLTNETIQDLNVDFVISNVKLNLKDIIVVQISEFPTERELCGIKKLLCKNRIFS